MGIQESNTNGLSPIRRTPVCSGDALKQNLATHWAALWVHVNQPARQFMWDTDSQFSFLQGISTTIIANHINHKKKEMSKSPYYFTLGLVLEE